MPHNTSIAWRRFGNALIVVHAAHFSDEDWHQFIGSDESGSTFLSMLVFPNGARLSAPQRAQAEAVLKHAGAKTAVVTDSAITRGVVTALRWFNLPIAAFSPDALDDAFDYAKIPAPLRGDAVAVVAQMHHELGLPRP